MSAPQPCTASPSRISPIAAHPPTSAQTVFFLRPPSRRRGSGAAGAGSGAGGGAAANDDQRVGVEIVRKAIQWPARQIAENAGLDGAVVVGKLLESNDSNWGFDAQANEYGDLVSRGVIDPAKVVRTALQDAASVAGLLITTEAMVAEKPKKESPMPAGGPGGGMGGMGDMDF